MIDATFVDDLRCHFMEDAVHPESVTHRPLVLVVEDEPLLLMLYEDAVAAAGGDVITAMTVSEGLDALARRVDVAILDIRLAQGERVFPVARRLVEEGVPFLFCTGTAHDMPAGEFASARIMAKPISADRVVAEAMAMASRGEACHA